MWQIAHEGVGYPTRSAVLLLKTVEGLLLGTQGTFDLSLPLLGARSDGGIGGRNDGAQAVADLAQTGCIDVVKRNRLKHRIQDSAGLGILQSPWQQPL